MTSTGYDIRLPNEDDLRDWRRMTADLLKRSWWVWAIYFAFCLMAVRSYILVPFPQEWQMKIVEFFFETFIAIVMIESGMVVAMWSDERRGFIDQLRYSLTTRGLATVHRTYVLFCQLLIGTFFYATGSATYAKIAKRLTDGEGWWFDMISLSYSLSAPLGAVMLWSLLSLSQIARHHVIVLDRADDVWGNAVRIAVNRKCPPVIFNRVMFRFMLLWMALFIPFFFPVVAYMLTWRYVAGREMLFQSGNKVHVKQTEAAPLAVATPA